MWTPGVQDLPTLQVDRGDDVWPILLDAGREGTTLTWDPAMTEDRALHGGPGSHMANAGFVVHSGQRGTASDGRSCGFEILAPAPDAFLHPTDGYVGLHIMHRRL